MGSEVRWKSRLYHLGVLVSRPEPIKSETHSPTEKILTFLTQIHIALNRDVGLCLAHGSKGWAWRSETFQ